jgi:hypothetical protein
MPVWDTEDMSLSRADAIGRVALYSQAAQYPAVSTTDIGIILDEHERFETWTASTVYAIGDRVVPSIPNGRVYECRQAGTSGTTEPEWPSTWGWTWEGFLLTEGTSNPQLAWVDMGPANVERYDVRTATRAVWLLKAGLVATEIDAKEGPSDVKLSQLQAQFLTMAERFRPVSIF